MKRIIIGLTISNFTLLGLVIYLFNTRPFLVPQQAVSTQVSHHIESLAPSSKKETTWRQIESEDYRVYIANLRAFGCPEETVRDILIADVNKLYGVRRNELLGTTKSKYWWQANEQLPASMKVERERQLAELDQEKRQLLIQLLGIDVEKEMQKYAIADESISEKLSFIPVEKREKIKSLMDKYHEQEAVLNASDDPSSAPDWPKLKQLHDEREAELARLLSPAEFQEYQLRNSETAENLRRNLVGFHPSEEEFRKIFDLMKTHDDRFAFLDPSDSTAHQKKQAELKQAGEQLKTLLGEQRFSEYERSQSLEFQNLIRLTRQYDLPEDSATRIFEKNKSLQQRLAESQSDASLTVEQKEAALRGFQEDLQNTIKDSLGERAFKYYQRWGNNHWLQNN